MRGRKKASLMVILTLVVAFAFIVFPEESQGDLAGPYPVTRVVDGDTIVVAIAGEENKVRPSESILRNQYIRMKVEIPPMAKSLPNLPVVLLRANWFIWNTMWSQPISMAEFWLMYGWIM